LFHWPEDEEVYKDIEHSFIVGDALKVTPVLHSNLKQDLIMSYFPNGTWVSMNDFS
jgi:alpha-glucosidase (family GH31 glycosyl hydrolase)